MICRMSQVWTIAQLVNFKLVPIEYRPVFGKVQRDVVPRIKPSAGCCPVLSILLVPCVLRARACLLAACACATVRDRRDSPPLRLSRLLLEFALTWVHNQQIQATASWHVPGTQQTSPGLFLSPPWFAVLPQRLRHQCSTNFVSAENTGSFPAQDSTQRYSTRPRTRVRFPRLLSCVSKFCRMLVEHLPEPPVTSEMRGERASVLARVRCPPFVSGHGVT